MRFELLAGLPLTEGERPHSSEYNELMPRWATIREWSICRSSCSRRRSQSAGVSRRNVGGDLPGGC